MKWKTFWQVVLLMIIAGAIFYTVCPKYYFYSEIEKALCRGNKITGKAMLYAVGKWKVLEDKKP